MKENEMFRSKKNMRVAFTPNILAMAKNAKGRNRSVYLTKLKKEIAKGGIHFLEMDFIHNAVELRTKWMVWLKSEEGTSIWLDVDFDVFEKNTYKAVIKGDRVVSVINSAGMEIPLYAGMDEMEA
jgi:hypothetical protein